MRSCIDLHIHTTASDGSDTPPELARKVAAAGLTLFSVTDHDTIDGALEMERFVPAGVRYLRGVEFSCTDPAGKCHILGYNYDPDHPAFQAALREGRQLRLDKMQLRVEQLRRDFGLELTKAEADWLWSRKSPGKPHLGRIILDRGLADTIDGAIRGFIRDVPGRDRIEAKTAVEAITASGGFPVWAHPLGGEGEKRLSSEQFEGLLSALTQYGIRGLECHYARYSAPEAALLNARAKALGLVPTGGSDYHGSNKRGIELGVLGTDTAPWAIDSGELFGIILQKGRNTNFSCEPRAETW